MPYSVTEINEAIRRDPAGFARDCDAGYTEKVRDAAGRIAAHRGESHIVLLSGPSGSGKTTTALKIEEELRKLGIVSHTVSMDDYFKTYDPETAPRNRDGDVDYESPFCLDVDLLNRHFAMLDRGELIHIPKYEFARQMRSDIFARPMRLGKDEIVIFEGIHALNDIIVGKNPRAFKLYIAARSDIMDGGDLLFDRSWIRLCRRIVRDFQFRGAGAAFTLKLWNNVRRGERLYISPYKENADIRFDSSLPLSASALKPFVIPLLEQLPKGQYQVVEDILGAYQKIEPLDERFIAPDSLAREFIGGSTYDNH